MNAVFNYIEKILIVLLTILLISFVTLVFMQVLFRYALQNSLTWSEEISRYLLVWFSLLGSTLAVRKYSHFAIDFIRELFPRRFKPFIKLFGNAVILFFLFFLLVKGMNLTLDKFFVPSPAAGIPMGLVYMSIPISALLMLLFHIEDSAKIIINELRSKNESGLDHLSKRQVDI